MGICKCEQRKVTNLFCFEHRVNVCQVCLVDQHPRCVVKSYLQWLKDSEYEPACTLCKSNLAESTDSECIRLLCLDVFHRKCLDEYCCQLPITTAPAGYECPTCNFPIIPAVNKGGPLAEKLKEFLKLVSWASEAPLGSPLKEQPIPALLTSQIPESSSYLPEQRLLIDTPSSEATFSNSLTRPLISAHNSEIHNEYRYSDEHKYRRKPFFDWLSRLIRTFGGTNQINPARWHRKKKIFLAVLLIVFVLTILSTIRRMGSYVTSDDPEFDPRNNPDIRFDRSFN
ncbi:hypothetical protein Ciccas_001894 [Cichlidogyrus casuarinus]|uniref:RING-type domain-containing protein n=1 Tax=Cichlidogyrus casuarinus TaxID=1844966 RepID=A0ABD2QIS4_9PLAT